MTILPNSAFESLPESKKDSFLLPVLQDHPAARSLPFPEEDPHLSELREQVERQQREIDLLEQIRRAFLSNPDGSKVFRAVVKNIASTFGYPLVSIYLLQHGELKIQAQVGYDNYFQLIPLGQGVNGRVASTGQPVFVEDIRTISDYLEAAPGVGSEICVPLLGRGKEVLGTLSIEGLLEKPLELRDYKLCLALAEHIVLALEQSRLYQIEQRRAKQFALLNQIGRDLTTTLDVETIIERVIGPVRQKLGFYSVNIGLLEEDALIIRLSLPSAVGLGAIIRVPLSIECLSVHCVTSGEMMVVQDVRQEPRYLAYSALPDTCSEMLVPLRAADQIIGILDIESDRVNAFDDDDIILLKTLADQTSIALENARRFQRLEQQSQELKRTNEMLIKSDRLKTEFLANMSHELRTPLNSILGYSEMLCSGFFGEIPPDACDPLDRVYRNGQRLLSLINEVLDLSYLEAGNFQINLQEFELETLIRATAADFEEDARKKGLDFKLDIELSPEQTIFNDPKIISQILSNLISNAVKFTSEGQVTVRTSAWKQDLSIMEIQVRDTGIGIAESEFEHIFEQFRQIDGSTTRNYGGTGLGLALVARISKQIQGTIRVESVPGKGSTFTLLAPFNLPI